MKPVQGIRFPSICPNRAESEASSAAVMLSVDNRDSSSIEIGGHVTFSKTWLKCGHITPKTAQYLRNMNHRKKSIFKFQNMDHFLVSYDLIQHQKLLSIREIQILVLFDI